MGEAAKIPLMSVWLFIIITSLEDLLSVRYNHLNILALDGLVVIVSAFGTEGWEFESMNGYTPDSDMSQDDKCVVATL